MKKQIIMLTLIAMSVVFVPVSAFAVTETATEPSTMAREKAAAAKEAAKARVLQAKADAQARKLTLAADRCEARKEKLTAVVPKLGKGITSVKASLDKNYDRIVAVHEGGKLNTPDYDTLFAAVDDAKATAEGSISAIDPSSVTVDCSNKSLGTQLDSYRQVVKETRDDLKAYHKALVDLVSAMNASSNEGTEESTDESN